MPSSPKISLIIPVYNVEKYLRQCLDSAVNQTLKEIEIIVINDCSPDNSMRIIEEFAKNDERFIVLNQTENKGQGVARNRALDIAKGEYIMFLDPDDWLELDACQKAFEKISKNKNEIVFFNLYSWKDRKGVLGKRVLNSTRLKPFLPFIQDQHIKLWKIEGDWLPAAWTTLQIYSKEFLNKNQIRFSDARYAEDLPFFVKAVISSEDISILNEPLYNYRKKIGNFTIDYTKVYDSAMTAKDTARKIILESKFKEYFWEKYLIYEIGSDLQALKTFAKANKNIRKGYYNKVRDKFLGFREQYSIDVLKRSSEYDLFNLVLKSKTYNMFVFMKFLNKIFRLGGQKKVIS